MWELSEDGRAIQAGEGAMPTIAPGGSALVDIPCALAARRPGALYLLTVRFLLAQATPWAEAGHEVAWAQVELGEGPRVARPVQGQPLSVQEEGTRLIVHSGASEIVFDSARGVIERWRVGGHTLLTDGPRLTIWRAAIDNEARGSGEAVVQEWRSHFLHLARQRLDHFSWQQSDEALRVTVRATLAPPVYEAAFDCVLHYTIFGGGAIRLELQGTPRGAWPATLPRLGLELTVPGTLDQVTWLGRGPGESYADSQQAARVGLWQRTVDELFTPYVRPQENGNHTDTRWVALRDARGIGLLAVGDPTLDFSAHRFTTADLDRAQHSYELRPRPTITLHLDYRQNGLGSGSCGPGVLPPYQLRAEPFTFGFWLRALQEGGTSVPQLARASRGLSAWGSAGQP